MSYTRNYLAEASQIIKALDIASIDHMAKLLVAVRECGGRHVTFVTQEVQEGRAGEQRSRGARADKRKA